MKEPPTTSRIKSRRPFYSTRINDFTLQEKWKQEWQENILTRGYLVEDPTNPQPAFHSLTRKQRTIAKGSEHDKTEQLQPTSLGLLGFSHPRNSMPLHKTWTIHV